MRNELRNIEKALRTLAKRCREIKYTKELLFSFLITGALSYGANLKRDESSEKTKEQLENSIDDMKELFKESRKENNRLLRNSNLELIQLMEQGDHVVKSPWSSWQFGMNMFVDSWGGTYGGRGDKSQKYPYEGVFTRGEWWVNNVSPDSKAYGRVAINSDPTSTSTKTRNDLGLDYGLVGTLKVVDPGVPFIIEPVISINTPPLPNLNVNPVIITPNVEFNIPDVVTASFKEIEIKAIKPNVFNPPALNEVSTGFGQGREVGYNTAQNYVISNSNVVIDAGGSEFTVRDDNYTRAGGLSWNGGNDRYNSATLVPSSQIPNLADTEFRSVIDSRDLNGGQEFESIEGSVAGTVTYSSTDYSVYTRDIPTTENIYKETPDTGVDYRYLTRPDKKLPKNVIDGTPGAHSYNSQQTIINMLTDDVTISGGKLILKNETEAPRAYGNSNVKTFYTNTLRAVSVNHAYGSLDKTTEFRLKSDLDLYGRDGINDKIGNSGVIGSNSYGNTPHMTIGIEHQAYGSLGARAINEGTMTLKAVDAKTGAGTATNLIGMTAMIEDYNDFRAIPIGITGAGNANAGIDNGWFFGNGTVGSLNGTTGRDGWTHRRQAPWESTMENRGKIAVEAINSIGIDFGEYSYTADLRNHRPFSNIPALSTNPHLPEVMYPTGTLAYKNKGSLNIYVKVGNIELTGIGSGETGSYGLRVPNVFAGLTSGRQRAELYFDDTIIDGTVATGNKGIEVKGTHNVGVSISKLITSGQSGQTDTLLSASANSRVRQYQAGELSGLTPEGGIKPHLIARDRNDPIGNIYGLNIEVNGTENVGLLRKSDYMNGIQARIDADGKDRARKDFKITDGHVQSIDFTGDAKGGVLFRTDKHGIDLSKTNFNVTPMTSRQTDANGNDMFNIVMLSNGEEHGVNTGKWYNLSGIWRDTEGYATNDFGGALTIVQTPVKVMNSTSVTLGSVPESGYNLIGLMAYKGGQAISKADITVNSNNSIGMVVDGAAVDHTYASAQITGNPRNGKPRLADVDSKGEINGSTITVAGKDSTGVYNNGRIFNMVNGTANVTGKNAVGIYASSTIKEPAETGAGTRTLGTTIIDSSRVDVSGEGSIALYANDGANITLRNSTMEIKKGALLFYGNDHVDLSQLFIDGTNNTATIKTGGAAFYFKTAANLANAIDNTSTGNLNLLLEDGGVLNVVEGDGVTATNLSTITATTTGTGIVPGTKINILPASGRYINTRAARANLFVDKDVNLDDVNDVYLNSEFSSSSITVNAGHKITGSAALTTSQTTAEIVEKSKIAIAQSNSGNMRNDVILTNNGTISLTGNEMAGIVGEFSEIYNNSILNTTGNDSAGIIVSNGGIATNSSTGLITVGTNGVGMAGINYLGVTDTPKGAAPSNGNRGMEIVNNGTITSSGTSNAIGILALDDESENISGALGPHNITLGNGSRIDVSSGTSGIGVYSKIANRNVKTGNLTDNGADIRINSDGIGLYTDGTAITATGGTIESVNGSTGKGIYTNESVTTSKNIKLLGDKSIGIHTYGNSIVNVNNTGVITMGDSTDKNNPSIGIYAPTQGTVNHTGGQITVGNRSLGIYSVDNSATVSAPVTAGDEGMTVYKKGGSLTINGALTSGNSSVAVYGDGNVSITNNSPSIKVGDSSFGFVISDNGTNSYTGSASSAVTMGSGSVYLYKAGEFGTVESGTTVNLSPGAGRSTGIYAKDSAVITNKGTMNFAGSVGNIGAYAENYGTVYNEGTLNMAGSDIMNDYYSIGMAARNAGKVVNKLGGVINVTGNYGIGMFAEGAGSRAENHGTINLMSSGELKGAYGMYLNNGAYGYIASGASIKSGAYSGSSDKESLIGVAVLNGSTLENHGTIDIDARNSNGIYVRNGIIKNYGTINISGANSHAVRSKNSTIDGTTPVSDSNIGGTVNASNGASGFRQDPDINNNVGVGVGGTQISPTGVVTVNGELVNIHDMTPGPDPLTGNFAFSNVGIYVDTLGRTNPINWIDGFNPGLENDLIIGAEAADVTTAKAIKIGRNILSPYVLPYMNLTGTAAQTLNAISGSLTWVVKPIAGASGYPEEAIMAKIPYTDFVSRSDNAWNFTDGLEQRYGVEGIGTREKTLFNKLNSIGKNEQVLLTQAFDEMMGHQYANTQQRIYNTGRMLDKEIIHLKKEWATKSKESNKVKVFGMKDEYRTSTAGIIDYDSNAYGVAYVHEDETVKLGNTTGWYGGAVHNRLKFKDIGGSTEETTLIKLGIFKSRAFDDNNSLNWTVSGEGFVSRSDMHRKYLVVDEIFNAKSDYHAYGVALKNEIGKEIRTGERTSIRPYGSLKLEYGRTGSIQEKSGEVRLEVDRNDYYSIRPEIGVELKYKQPLAKRTTLTATLGAAYESELGKVGDTGNRARVNYTAADWFEIPGEKDDRKGNIKTDLNVGIENQRVGVTFNAGYDTKGDNARFGIGVRAIY